MILNDIKCAYYMSTHVYWRPSVALLVVPSSSIPSLSAPKDALTKHYGTSMGLQSEPRADGMRRSPALKIKGTTDWATGIEMRRSELG